MGNKFWSILFGATMLACLIGFAISPLMGWWMPDGVSAHAAEVDFLFYVILWITTFFFILTEAILVGFMWQYTSQDGKRPVNENADVAGFLKPLTGLLDSQHKVEMAWTLVPAAILIYISFAQIKTWADIKYASRNQMAAWDSAKFAGKTDEEKTPPLQIAVSARQFEWRMRYPSVARFTKDWKMDAPKNKGDYDSFGKMPHADDILVVNELHIWQNHSVAVHLTTRDVIHSFNLPNFRVKQDALPGKMIPVWFKTLDPAKTKTVNVKWDEKSQRYQDGINPETGKEDLNYTYDIACAELCGWGHYRMIGRVYVHKDMAEFVDWLKKAESAFHKRN